MNPWKIMDAGPHAGRVDRFREHGSEWLTCRTCGALWHLHDCLTENGIEYQEAEQVEHGDGYCHEKAEVEL